jgi:hypothetical protein
VLYYIHVKRKPEVRIIIVGADRRRAASPPERR